ncbi:MAG: dihydroorotate dehydrogenase [Acidimicrobiales bacterium]|nr:dihydroorotate dehydrogenase [Acidimicrobiales bacterium]
MNLRDGCRATWTAAGRRGSSTKGILGAAVQVVHRPDLTAQVGSVTLRNPVMTASGTAGHGAELAAYFDLSSLGAVVVKSVSAEPWDGNPPPRLLPLAAGMLNSVGLQNRGMDRWRSEELPPLAATGASVVASIWGFTAAAYEQAAAALVSEGPPAGVVAVEANISCPNVEDRRKMFAHSCHGVTEAVGAAAAGLRGSLPLWAKLSPNVTDLPELAGAAAQAGAEAVTLVNTVMGLALDPATGHPRLGGGGGGLSGPAIHPVAVRAVYECRQAHPGLPIVGVGGVSSGADAAELLVAGADAVQVGTATFADPRAPARVLEELHAWCAAHGIADLKGIPHANQ